MRFRTLLVYLFSTFLLSPIYAATTPALPSSTPTKITPTFTDNLPWAALFYWGRTANNTMYQVVEFNPGGFLDETLYSAELSRRLSLQNPVQHFFQRFLLVSSSELNANFTYRDDTSGPIYEVDPYFSIRWTKFPWNKYVATGFGIGEGISYDSHISSVEINNTSEGNTQRLLNFLMLELTFALPKNPKWELVARIHHRSGVFGLYNAKNSGASAVGLGIRYRF